MTAPPFNEKFYVFRPRGCTAIEVDASQHDHRQETIGGRQHEYLFDRPIRARVATQSPPDFCSTQVGGVVLISDRAVREFGDHGVTGLEFVSIDVEAIEPTQGMPQLHRFFVTGWGGMAAEASGIRPAAHTGWPGILTYTMATHPELVVDESRWDGSDFFVVWPLSRHWLVTARTAALLHSLQMTGYDLETLGQQRIRQTTSFSQLGTGPLRMFLPEDRARQLGEPLGIY